MSTGLSTRPHSQTTARADRTPLWPEKSVYHPDQQVEYLHLQAEIDTLMLELQTRKQQQLVATHS